MRAQAREFAAPVLQDAAKRASYFVQFNGSGAADAARSAGGEESGEVAADSRRTAIENTARGVLGEAQDVDSRAASLFTVTNAIPGAGLSLNRAALTQVASDSRVAKVTRLATHTVTNSSTAVLSRALNAWKYQGNTGRGVRIGIIDTGIDYTHADFGGPGTVEAYEGALADNKVYNWRARLGPVGQAKILGGYDFAGDDYNPDPSADNYDPLPAPDPDPLDCTDHGTHVAGTAAGYGVDDQGETFRGSYKKLNARSVMKMDIGPGMAPDAGLYGLRVFGCDGSTDLVIAALDYSLDPNGDGDFSDHLDIINMSLGSSFAPVDNPENDVIDELSQHGVLSVISMGNSGDLTDAGGEPGSAVSSLAVASSVDGLQQRDGLLINAPSGEAGTAAGQMSVAYDWLGNGPTGAPVTGDVVAIPGANADGCEPFSPAETAAVVGKVAWLEWDDNDATRRCGSVGRSGNALAAGATGSIFTSGLDVFGGGITGSTIIPVFQLPKAQTDRLRPAAEAGTLNVTFDGALQATIKDVTQAIADTVSGFSSRGPHGSYGVVKPDVAMVGDSVSSALVGSGNKVLTISGTSMSAPGAAGTAALVKATHPKWTPLSVKAAIMNTATHDVWTEPNRSGERYAPARVGAGRLDAREATRTRFLAYTDGNRGVSTSFGVVPAPVDGGVVTRTKQIVIRNTRPRTSEFALRYEAINPSPGVSYTVSPATVKVARHSIGKVTVTMRVDPTALRHTIDPTMEAEQANVFYGEEEARQFVSDSSGRVLVKEKRKATVRVPVYGAAKPTSSTSTSLDGEDLVISGTGFATGEDASDYSSLTSVLELGATSPQLPECDDPDDVPVGCASRTSDKGADLQHVGAASDDELLTFGLSTYGDWPNVGTAVIPYVDFDVDGDDVPDYEIYLQNIDGTDLLYAWTIDFEGNLYDLEPVNLLAGDVDSNVFDTNVVTMSLFKEAIGLPTDGTSTPISYQVGMYSAFTDGDIDTSELVTFDAGTPTISAGAPLFADEGDSAIELVGSRAEDAQALVLHFHGALGERAQVIDVPALAEVRKQR